MSEVPLQRVRRFRIRVSGLGDVEVRISGSGFQPGSFRARVLKQVGPFEGNGTKRPCLSRFIVIRISQTSA